MTNDHDKCDLASAEWMSPERQSEFHKRLAAAIEKRLTRSARIWWGVIAALSFGMCFYFVSQLVLNGANSPLPVRPAMLIGAIFALSFGALSITLLIRGTYHRVRTSQHFGLITWIFVVLLVTGAVVFAPESISGLRMILASIAALIFGCMFLIQNQINQAKLKIIEHILAIHVQLSDPPFRSEE